MYTDGVSVSTNPSFQFLCFDLDSAVTIDAARHKTEI